MSDEFVEYLTNHKKENIRLFLDIETFQYNEDNGKQKPTLYKNCVYSVACSWVKENNEIGVIILPNFYDFFELVKKAFLNKRTRKPMFKKKIILTFHNGNKYDNHYMLFDLVYYYQLKRENEYLSNALKNDYTYKEKDLTKEQKEEGVILEKRVKSSNNLAMKFYLNGLAFETEDSFMKTNASIATLGKKLLAKNLVTEDELKTDFNYTQYNLPTDLTDNEAKDYANYIFHTLNEEQLIYIRNDVIILAKAVLYYDRIYPNFDYSKMTLTQNILGFYNTDEKVSYQLLNKIPQEKRKPIKINYTDYNFNNENLYDFLLSFYRGGLNFYNDNFIAKIVKDCFSMDRNSSYPHVMYSYKLPTFLHGYQYYKKSTIIDIDTSSEFFYMYRMSKTDFNKEVLLLTRSNVLKKMLVKYYNVNDYVNITTFTLKLIEEIEHIKIEKLPVLSWLSYECEYFESREQIEKMYFIKTQGKLKNVIKMKNPMDYEILEERNTVLFSQEEINLSKVNLNGLYGIPALRAYYNMFRTLPDGSLQSFPNGYKNNERNLVFSIAVTTIAFYELLRPLANLTSKEIDENFVYCDTDSLYLKKKVKEKMPDDLFDPISLGKWDIENQHISEMYVLNHKKYAYYSKDNKGGHEKGIVVKSGGIPVDSFNTNLTFSEFIEQEFHDGKQVKNIKSIYNKQGTISIYNSYTEIEKGARYSLFFTKALEDEKNEAIEYAREHFSSQDFDDIIYLESAYGTISQRDLHPVKNSIENTQSIAILKARNMAIKRQYFD